MDNRFEKAMKWALGRMYLQKHLYDSHLPSNIPADASVASRK